MGQKINPNLLRLGIKKFEWKSKYFENTKEEFSLYSYQSLEIKQFLRKFLTNNRSIFHDFKLQYYGNIIYLFISYYATCKTANLLINKIGKQQKFKVKKDNFYRKFKRKKKIKKQQFLVKKQKFKVKKFLNNSNNETKKNLTNKIIKKFQKTKTKNIIQKKFKKRIKILKNYNNNSLKVNHQKIKFLKLNHFTEQLLESLSIFTNKKFISYFFKNWKTMHILVICTISLFLLVQSPILSILWLIISTLYLLYIHSYKDISKIWGFTIGIWYLIFTISLSEITILIGFENTTVIIDYLLDNNFLFENLCFQTVYIFDALSAKLGFSIYIPAVVFSN
jgi:hypothetical protein